MSESREQIERRTDAAFANSEWQDPRADYRALLKRLRERDAAAFEEAVRAYEEAVVARLGDSSVDPVAAWIEYGRRLAHIAGGGRTVRIDDAGRAADATETEAAEPELLLHLPADEAAPAIVVVAPREPSAAQRATAALLAGGAQALAG